MNERITMAHGAGGRAMRELVQAVLTTGPGHDMDDGAVVPIGDRFLVFTTDSHVVQPLFFPGGDIGRLAVCGTVNDLAMMGATDVIGLSCALVIEEGFPIDLLRRVKQSMDHACAEADTRILTGDTKVMARGEVDGLVIIDGDWEDVGPGDFIEVQVTGYDDHDLFAEPV